MIRDQLVGNTEENICSGNTFGSSRKGGGRGGAGGKNSCVGPVGAVSEGQAPRERVQKERRERERERAKS